MKSIKVPYFKQDTDYTCGPTSLQMVLAYYGVRDSELSLSKQLRTNSDDGTCPLLMHETVIELGFHCYVNVDASFEEILYLLSLEIPPIVRFIEPDENDDHYGVVVSATESKIEIHDPWNGPDQVFSKIDFMYRWRSDAIDNCNQWLMAVSPEPLPLGRQFHPK